MLKVMRPMPYLKKQIDEDFIAESMYHDLTSLIYKNFTKSMGGLPDELLKEMETSYNKIIAINIFFAAQFFKMKGLLLQYGIPIVPIKGIALLCDIYEDLGMRPMQDIDVLLEKKYLKKAMDILKELEYHIDRSNLSEEYFYKNHCHIPLSKKGPGDTVCVLELHWDLAAPKPYKIKLPELWKRVRKVRMDNGSVELLAPEDNIFSLLLHLRRFNRPFSLKYIFDIAEISRHHKIDWAYIYKYSKSNMLMSLVYYSLLGIKCFFGTTVSEDLMRKFYPGILRAFLLRFLLNKTKKSGALRLRISPAFRKYAYLFLRFLLYDHSMHFIKFVILMPIEEFSRFWSIEFPSKKAWALYRLRFIIMPFYLFKVILNKNENSAYRF